MGLRARSGVLAVLVAAAMVLGLVGAPVDGASPLGCPQICLTGGSLTGRSTSASSVSVDSVASSESRFYRFAWTALDQTEFPPVQGNLLINILVSGAPGQQGAFQGTGTAYMFREGFAANRVKVSLIDGAELVVVSLGSAGGNFLLTSVGGVGTATYVTSTDHDWDNPASTGG